MKKKRGEGAAREKPPVFLFFQKKKKKKKGKAPLAACGGKMFFGRILFQFDHCFFVFLVKLRWAGGGRDRWGWGSGGEKRRKTRQKRR